MAIYRGNQLITGFYCAGISAERIFNGSTLVFAAHDTVKITIVNTPELSLSLYAGTDTATPLAALSGTALTAFAGNGTFTVNYNAAGFYLAPVSEAGTRQISVTLLNCRMETQQTLSFSAASGGTFTIPRYGGARIEVGGEE